jgi:endoglucanase
VTWADHFISDYPSYTIDPVWLQRVSDVVDMITSNGLYTFVNAHHDSSWLDPTVPNANFTMMQEKFYALWYQVGSTLGCKSSLVGFEALNEPAGSSASDAKQYSFKRSMMPGVSILSASSCSVDWEIVGPARCSISSRPPLT